MDSPSSVPAPEAPAPAVTSTPAAVVVRCDVERIGFTPWTATMIEADHAVFSNHVPPTPGLVKIPPALHRAGTQSTNRADLASR